jgi:hypothetical protein
MKFVACENAGPNVTPWLHFNAATDDFYGTVPLTASGTARLAVVAYDGRFKQATDLFRVTFAPAPHAVSPSQEPLPRAHRTFNPQRPGELIALHT